MISTEFLLTALVVVAVPGTGVIYTISTGIGRGTRAAIIAAIGCTLGIIPHVSAAALGLTAILHASAHVFRCVRLVGVAYLLYLAYSTWRSAGAPTVGTEPTRERGIRIVMRAVLLNLLNPRLTLFFFAFLPQFVPADAETPIMAMTILSAAFMLLTLCIFVVYGVTAAAARRVITGSRSAVRRMQRSFAVILALFAIRLATSDE
ncbi:MAG: LysE family translocator [Spirochaetales bacterium]|nr:LysE family translocator [Spirochaetales bacterium]